MEKSCSITQKQINVRGAGGTVYKDRNDDWRQWFLPALAIPRLCPWLWQNRDTQSDLTICRRCRGDEIDGALVRAGLMTRRYAHQSHKDLRNAINAGTVAYSDIHISHLPMNMNQKTGPNMDIALVECVAVTEEGCTWRHRAAPQMPRSERRIR